MFLKMLNIFFIDYYLEIKKVSALNMILIKIFNKTYICIYPIVSSESK